MQVTFLNALIDVRSVAPCLYSCELCVPFFKGDGIHKAVRKRKSSMIIMIIKCFELINTKVMKSIASKAVFFILRICAGILFC